MSILDEAAQLVDGDRGATYGHPADDFGKVTGAASSLGINPLSGPLHHALYMILVKLSRLVETPDHHDSIVDIAGYALTYEKIWERMLEKNEELWKKTEEEDAPDRKTLLTMERSAFEEWKQKQIDPHMGVTREEWNNDRDS